MWLEGIMLALQLACMGQAVYLGLWWKSLYWLGAFILTLAVMRGINS